MPPKKPALPGPRRTVAVGSHQILFSSPIEGARGRSSSNPRGDGARTGKRDKSLTRAGDLPSKPVTDYSHVQSKVRAQFHGATRDSSSSGLPSASFGSRVLPPSPPPPRELRLGQPQRTYEEIPGDAAFGGGSSLSLSSGDYGSQRCTSPASPLLAGNAAERLSAARVTRLLKNARAAVDPPFRPETPLELLQPTTDKAREAFLKGKPLSGAGVRRGRYGVPGSGGTHRATAQASAAAPLLPGMPKGGRLSSLSPPAVPLALAATGSVGTSSLPRGDAHNPGALPGSPELPPAGDSFGQHKYSGDADVALPPALALLLSMGSGATAAAAHPAISSMNPENFLPCLQGAEGNPQEQVLLLRELARWLSHPRNVMWPAWLTYFGDYITACNSGVAGGGLGFQNSGGTTATFSGEACAVASVMAVTVLRNTSLQGDDGAPLAEVVLLLRHLVTSPLAVFAAEGVDDARTGTAAPEDVVGTRTFRFQQQHRVASLRVVQWLEQELAFEPLLHLLSQEWVVEQQPHVAVDVLETLRGCTSRAAGEGARRNSGASETSLEGNRTQTSEVAPVLQHLVTLGAIPTLNSLLRRLLGFYKDAVVMAQRNGGDASGEHGLRKSLPQLLSGVCLLYRDLSPHFSHHMLKLGTLPLLVSVLEAATHAKPTATMSSTLIVSAASRALAKLMFDPGCLEAAQADTSLMKAGLATLAAQLTIHEAVSLGPQPTVRDTRAAILVNGRKSSGGSSSSASLNGTLRQQQQQQQQEQTLFHLLISRLCSVMAQVAEGCAAQQQFLAQYGTAVELSLLNRFLSAPLAATSATATQGDEAQEEDDDDALVNGGTLMVVQCVVWLVGVTAMAPELPLTFVEEATTQLTLFLQTVDASSAMGTARNEDRRRLAMIYALMCLSNLSFYFPAIEARSDSGVIFLEELYRSLGLVLAAVLVRGDVEAAVEATRTLGNMSFTNTGRDWMEHQKCDEVVLLFLGHEDLRVAYNCFGVVLNLTAATTCRVVEDGELLRMLLQYTGRFTSRQRIRDAAVEGQRQLSSVVDGDGAAAVAQDYAEQIADLVEKCLANVRGLLEAQQAPSAEQGDDRNAQTLEI